jgi:PIN domain nuclease of toxin-antitoxin system
MLEAPLNREVALCSRTMRVEHDDPADRFFAATADVYDLVLATADKRLLHGKGFNTVANR